jgi:hypothetical protein
MIPHVMCASFYNGTDLLNPTLSNTADTPNTLTVTPYKAY